MDGIDPSEHPAFARGRLDLGLAAAGGLRWAAADLTDIVETARRRLDLSPVAAAALGRSMAGATVLLRLAAKTPARLVLEVQGDGPLRRVLAEADHRGNLRGMVGEPRVSVPHLPSGKLAVGRAVGRGTLRVAREHTRGTYNSQVELVSGEIGDDLAHYLEQSEQTRSAVLLGVLARPRGVAAAGGVIVEVLPQADEDALAALEANLSRLAGVSRLLEEGGLEQALEAVFAGLEPRVLESHDLAYRCRCDRRRLERHLTLLPEDDRRHLLDGRAEVEVDCVFCGERYTFAAEEIGLA